MRNFLNVATTLSMSTLLGACAPNLTIKSEPPGANVYLLRSNGDKHALGTTPIEVKVRDLEALAPQTSVTGEMIPLNFEASGFHPVQVMLPPMRLGVSEASINVQMKAASQADTAADQLLRYLHNAQKFANAGIYQSAIDEVDKALKQNPNFIRGLSMKGSILYVQNRFDESLALYEKALSLDEGFDEAIRMITEIKKRKGKVRSER